MEQYRLFIDDLAESLRGLVPRPDAVRGPDDVATTQAVGEEGDQPGDVTTMAVGEEGDQPGDVTTMAVGEEGDQPGEVTSMALGEEGDQPGDGDVTTLAVGEEGDQPDDPADELADRLADRFDDLEDDLDGFATDLDDRFAHLADRLSGLADGPTRGSGEPVATTQAVGEDGDQADPDPIDTGASTGAQGIAVGEPYPGSDTDDWVSADDTVLDEPIGDDSLEHDDHPTDAAF